MKLTSSAFEDGGSIPSLYTCDGDNKNPPLSIAEVPETAVSLVLIVEDPDVPAQIRPGGMFDHWVLFNIPASANKIDTGEEPGMAGNNGAGRLGYTGPCPPPQYEPAEHRYVFTLYALDSDLPLPVAAGKEAVQTAMAGHILDTAQLVGRYRRVSTE